MYNYPNMTELLAAVRQHLEQQIIPTITDQRLRFQTLVAINVLQIVERELNGGEAQLHHAWQRLTALGITNGPPPEGSSLHQAIIQAETTLCQQIQAGRFDDPPAQTNLINHLRSTAIAELEIANPKRLRQ